MHRTSHPLWWTRYGRWLSLHSRMVLGMILVLSFSLCLWGVMTLEIESNPERLWVASTSTTWKQKMFFDHMFGPFFRIEQLIFTRRTSPTTVEKNPHPMNLIEKPYLQALAKIQHTLTSDRVYQTQLCFRPIAGKGCLVESPLQLWNNNITLLDQDPTPHLTAACHPTLPGLTACMDNLGVPILPRVIFGGLSPDPNHPNPDPCGRATPAAKALVVTFLLDNRQPQVAQDWERRVFLPLVQAAKAELGQAQEYRMELNYMAQRSIQDGLAFQAHQNIFIGILSYIIMGIYITLRLGRGLLLPVGGIVLILFSIGLAIFTSLWLLRLQLSMITLEVTPFFLLAIGVDNIFLIVQVLEDLESDNIFSMGNLVENVGPSMTFAAVMEITAFGIGALTTSVPALRDFCIFSALALGFNYVLQMTCFLALVQTLGWGSNQRRARFFDSRDVLDDDDSAAEVPVPKTQEPPKSTVERRNQSSAWGTFLFSKAGQVSVLSAWIVLTLLSLSSLPSWELGLSQRLAMPTDFYMYDYLTTQETYGEAGPVAYLIIASGVTYTDVQTQVDLSALVTDVARALEPAYISGPVSSWLNGFNQWRQLRFYLHDKIQQGLCDCPPQDLKPFEYEQHSTTNTTTIPNSEFVPLVRVFLHIPVTSQCCQNYGICGEQYQSDVVFSTSSSIATSRLRFQLTKLSTETKFIRSYVFLQRFCEQFEAKTNLPVFAYSMYFIYYEQYLDLQGSALMCFSCAFAILGFMLWQFFFHQHTTLTLIVLCNIFSIVFQSLGILYLWNLAIVVTSSNSTSEQEQLLRLNGVSVVNGIMSLGIAVEFCIHIAHAYDDLVTSNPLKSKSRKSPAIVAWEAKSECIFYGIFITKALGILVLACAPSHLYRIYFFRMYMAMILSGGFHGLCVLPLMLHKLKP